MKNSDDLYTPTQDNDEVFCFHGGCPCLSVVFLSIQISFRYNNFVSSFPLTFYVCIGIGRVLICDYKWVASDIY